MRKSIVRAFALVIPGLFVTAFASCSGSGDNAEFGSAAVGTERGPCREDKSCDPGLECHSDVCVSGEVTVPSSGGDSNSGAGASVGAGATTSSSGGDGPSNSVGGAPSGNSGGEGPGTSSGGSNSGPGNGGSGNVVCEGSHPNVEDDNRFCDSGDCYCNDPFDTCFPEDIAGECCEGKLRCGDEAGDRGCGGGAHPDVDGEIRSCETNNCLCSGDFNGDKEGGMVDWCWPEDVAEECCPANISVECF
jgi:hypothetical protein